MIHRYVNVLSVNDFVKLLFEVMGCKKILVHEVDVDRSLPYLCL